MTFTGSSSNFSFPPPDALTASGPCGFASIEGGQCRPNLTGTLGLTLAAGGALSFPNTFKLSQQAPSAVPEPTTVLLLVPGIAWLSLSRKTRLFWKGP
jgi:hypothetical protein